MNNDAPTGKMQINDAFILFLRHWRVPGDANEPWMVAKGDGGQRSRNASAGEQDNCTLLPPLSRRHCRCM